MLELGSAFFLENFHRYILALEIFLFQEMLFFMKFFLFAPTLISAIEDNFNIMVYILHKHNNESE